MAYYDLFNAYLTSASPAELLVYTPSVDETNRYIRFTAISKGVTYATMTGITDGTGGTIVNNRTHLTVPFTADCTAVQILHMHTDGGGKWQ